MCGFLKQKSALNYMSRSDESNSDSGA